VNYGFLNDSVEDWCDGDRPEVSMLFGWKRFGYVYDVCLQKLQSVQNPTARLSANTRKLDHITPVLHDLHWLPIRQKIVFKTAILVSKCLCHFRAVDSCGLAILAFFTCQEQRCLLVAKVSRSPIQSHQTAYLLSCEHSNCLFRLLLSV